MDDSKTPKKIGRYEIRSELGRGGMSTVFLAYDPNVDRTVALKLLPREFLHHKEFRARFNREARIIAALEHSAIVPIYDFGDTDDQPYFVMRHMSGGSLADHLDKGAIRVEEAAKIIERIGSALQYAHSKGVVHRDLKPGNILFDQFGTAYLADFGIARLEETGATLTGSVFMGTPAYMSPEQVQAVHDLDGRADIYALGVILYEMLTGIKPYSAKTAAATALKHVTEPVPHILEANPNLPPDMEQVINKAMAKDPDQRYLLATDLTADVTLLAAGKTIVGAKPPTVPEDDMEATMIATAGVAAAAAAASASSAASSATEDTAIITPAEQAAAPSTSPPEASTGSKAAVAGVAAASAAGAGAAAAPSTQPPVETEEDAGRSKILVIALVALLLIVCLGAIGAGVIFAGGDGLAGIFDRETETPTLTMTVGPTETATETNTPTPTSTATETPTGTATATALATRTPIASPTVRPTNTVEVTETALPTFTRVPATATRPPLPPTLPPAPTSPPPQPTSAPPQPTSPPPRPTSPPPQPTTPPV